LTELSKGQFSCFFIGWGGVLMGRVLRILKAAAAGVAVIVVAGAGWLYVRPPELLRIGDGYAAKIVCSNVFLAGRDANAVLAEDVQAPGNPLLPGDWDHLGAREHGRTAVASTTPLDATLAALELERREQLCD